MGHASDVFGSRAGDLLLDIKVKEHDEFKLKDLNIYSDQPITLTQAILGDKITLNTPDGPRNVEIKKGTQHDQQIILKNYGANMWNAPENYDPNDLRGDHIVTYKVVLPKEFTSEQLDLLSQFAEIEKDNKERFYKN
jgi:molecular chaperone DnaJ